MIIKTAIKKVLKKAGYKIERINASNKNEVIDDSTTLNSFNLTQSQDVALNEEELLRQIEEKELSEVRESFANIDKEHVWAFISGETSRDFKGNPKYLFAYVNKYRPDIKAYWLCDDDETIQKVRNLQFNAYNLNSAAAQFLINRTGVVVVEQVKAQLPTGFNNVKYINLWHGVGFKTSERKRIIGDISMELARKYVRNGTYYRDYQLMNAPCPIVENEEKEDCGIDLDKFIRTGYPRCLYQQNFDPVVTFNHDLKSIKGISSDAKLVVYAPTYRTNSGETLSKAIPDFEALYHFCEQNNILFIFKLHPNMEEEIGFIKAKERYGEQPYFWFWDNKDDFYEIMHQMDLAIIDYSSIISDMVAMGVKHYIRYLFDFEDYNKITSIHSDNFLEVTTGIICYKFDDLLSAINDFEQRDESTEIERLQKTLWTYSKGKDDFERIIDAVFSFKTSKRVFPCLYSFDVFDTVLSRKVLAPEGIFHLVCEKMFQNGGFSYSFIQNYPTIRKEAEAHVRTYYSRTKDIRQSERVEITFDEIFDRIELIYELPHEKITLMKQWELDAEIDNVIPLPAQIEYIKRLLAANEKVVLISDMYLPKDFITRLLEKADPILATIPLFLSNEYGVLKTSQKLYFEVYKSFEPYYDFKKWIHYGDNHNADTVQARKFGINTRKITKPEFNSIERGLVDYIKSYDSYLVAGMQARLHEANYAVKDSFVISYIALCFVPYIDWTLRDAVKRGYKTLYFISRDGYHLKRIADSIIKTKNIPIKTKYIYASRRTWRIPSFIDKVDEGFWLPYGNFNGIVSKEKLLRAMDLDEDTFKILFPYIDLDSIDYEKQEEINRLIEIFKNSKQYNEYLLKIAAEKRGLVSGYLKQEINSDEKFAIVEFWGRGYTQDCMVNLWRDILQDNSAKIPFYYCRSVLPTIGGAIRYNFTTTNFKQFLIEAIFANMPYKSIEEYQMKDGIIEPVIEPIPYDKELFASMSKILPIFATEYAKLEFLQPEIIAKQLYDFVFYYFDSHKTDKDFAEQIGYLKDAVMLYGKKREFAPPFTMQQLDKFERGEIGRGALPITSSIGMSVTRSREDVQKRYCEMYQILPGDDFGSGRVLSKKERSDNNKFKKQFLTMEERAFNFKGLYDDAVERMSVVNKVVLLTNGKTIDNSGLDVLRDKIKRTRKFVVQVICLAEKSLTDSELAEDLASAKYIIVNNVIGLLCKVDLRTETKEILLPQSPFVLYNKGLASDIFLKWKQKFTQLTAYNDISVMQIPSKHREEFYKRNFCCKNDVDCCLLGNIRTDSYFDSYFKMEAECKLLQLFPEAKGKKRILYAPTWRTRSDSNSWLRMLDLELLQQLIGNEYVVIVNFNKDQIKHPTKNILTIPGFSKELNSRISYNELLSVCDISVGDYRDSFFESAILHKPTYSTADDYETIIQSGNMSLNANDFEKFLFCPVVSSAYELAEELQKVKEYDFTPMEKFKEWMFSGCDGHSVDNVVKFLLNDLNKAPTNKW